MPAYEFEFRNEETGAVLGSATIICPVGDRDKIAAHRVSVPRSVSISGGAADTPNENRDMLKTFHRLECRKGSKLRLQHSPETIKRAFSE